MKKIKTVDIVCVRPGIFPANIRVAPNSPIALPKESTIPAKIFLLIGTNDLIHNKSVDEIVDNIKKIIDEINESRPQTKIYLESIYPVNKDIDEDMVNVRDNKDIKKINKELKKYCKDSNCTYLNIYDELINKDGNFDEKYTDDGLHPNDKGYEVVTKELKKYLED